MNGLASDGDLRMSLSTPHGHGQKKLTAPTDLRL